ncbi:hypothetical protein PFISCL1PPCAC_545 [Pristionchus fissidentatus]|uniref:Peptidase S54 rhomboid domain-containing protein n=1 Tax=Pristionchus fissidentatus TaxID=1538716 RepID=A0AAV5USU1_9BILA|nr:hypothetical protein PFISCL1PPCAC_545 [Pristionchus fissidentatus]
MSRTPASAGGPRRLDTIEMSALGGSTSAPGRRLEKAVSMPLQKAKTPTAESGRVAFQLGSPPNRNPFQRGNTIREVVGDFVGLSEVRPEENVEMKSWDARRLKYFNRKFKLSKDFVESCEGEAPRLQAPMSPVLQRYEEVPQTPGLASFQVVEHFQDARARSASIESRRPRRESAIKIITENCASLITRGRLTPTASASTRIRRGGGGAAGISSFSVSESPLPSTSLTPAGYTGYGGGSASGYQQVPPSPLMPMPSVPSRGGEPPAAAAAEKDVQLVQLQQQPPQPVRTKKRELHRVIEADEILEQAHEGDGEVAAVVAADAAEAVVELQSAKLPASRGAAPRAAPPSAAIVGHARAAEPTTSSAAAADFFYLDSIKEFVQPEIVARDLPSTSGSPPFQLSRPTLLPMGDETASASMVQDELFFDITPPKRQLRSHAKHELADLDKLPLRGRDHRRGPIPLGRVSPSDRDLMPDRVVPAPPPKKVKFMEKQFNLQEFLKHTLEEKSSEQRTARMGGVGAFGECLGRKTKQLEQLPEKLRRRLKTTINERPFFTYWVTMTQVLVCLASICIFGFGEFSPSFAKKEREVLSLDQTLITVGVYEKGNIWWGPKFADLIRLGAKYSPCMRAEQKIMNRIELDRQAESYTGCCVHTDGSCYQAGESCPRTLATLYLSRNSPSLGGRSSSSSGGGASSGGLRRTQSSPDLGRHASPLSTARRSEIVCGLDPDFCASPSFHSFSREDITKWPLCDREIPESENGFRPRHLTCKVQGRPCCIHLQGRCRITTAPYCEFVGGIYHKDASLCSQVNCLHGICGMIPFGDSPNQIYRLFTSLFLHAGVLHLGVTIFFQMVFMRDLESYIGWKRMAFIYFISGVGGNLASSIFVPFNPEVGPSGALAGIVTTLFVDVFANRDILQQPLVALAQNGCWLLALFVVGLLPWVDNWAILFGTVFGLLATMVFFPDVGLARGAVFRRFIVIIGAISQILLFVLLFYIFVENIAIDCTWCGYFNCFNWYRFIAFDPDDGNHFCDNQGLTVNSWLPI